MVLKNICFKKRMDSSMKKSFILGLLVVVFATIAFAVGDTFYLNIPEKDFTNIQDSVRDGVCMPFYYLSQSIQKLGYKVKTINFFDAKNCAGCFFIGSPEKHTLVSMGVPVERCVLSVWEPPLICKAAYNDFSPYKILHLADHMVNNINSFKFFYPQASLEVEKEVLSFEEKKLCTMICSNKMYSGPGELYSARRKVIFFFENLAKKGVDDFYFYGQGGWPRTYVTFKGEVPHKRPVLKKYRFCFCYENSNNTPGYITEKIFDCLVSGCVPIYWGAENITDYVPEDCFIDRRNFANNQDLYEFLKSMSKEEYEKYLEHIKNYLSTPAAYLFSIDYFIDSVLSLTLGKYDKIKIFSSEQIAMLAKARAYYESIARLPSR
jgi:hypothetical protein